MARIYTLTSRKVMVGSRQFVISRETAKARSGLTTPDVDHRTQASRAKSGARQRTEGSDG